MKTWILSISIVLAGLLGVMGCSGGGGGDGDDPEPGPDPDIECLSTVDCDGDGLIDTCDSSPYDSTVVTPTNGEDGCDIETDADGNANAGDGYYDGPCSPYTVNADGTLDLTTTTDTVESYSRTLCDNCTTTYNPDQTDTDGDGKGDECDVVLCTTGDDDGDNVCDGDENGDGKIDDNCVGTLNALDTDTDGDGTMDAQADTDKDGTGDACDSSDDRDDDGDGYTVGAGDCNDSDASVNPGSTTAETFGGTDYNCDGATGSLSAALFVDLALCASLDGEDGSFNKPYNLLQKALDNLGDKTSIYVYKNDACSTENITVSKVVTIVGGVYCVDGDGDEINMATDSDDCADSSQIKGYVRSEGEDLDESSMPKITGSDSGPTITVTANATIDQLHIKAPTSKNGHAGVSIKDSSPTVKNSKIEAPENTGYTGNDSDGDGTADYRYTRAVLVEVTGVTTNPTLSGNTIIAGETGQGIYPSSSSAESGLPYYVFGIQISGGSGFGGEIKPTIKENSIEVGNGYMIASGIYVRRATEYSSSSGMLYTSIGDTKGPTIQDNDLSVGYAKYSEGVYFYKTGGKIERNIVEVEGTSETNGMYYAYGLFLKTPKASTYIYTNLFKVSLSASPYGVMGIYSDDGDMDVYANTIVIGEGGSGTRTYGVQLAGGVEARIASNIFRSALTIDKGSAIYEAYSSSAGNNDVTKFLNNLIDTNFTTAWCEDEDTGMNVLICNVIKEMPSDTNLKVSPGLNSSYKPSSTSEAVDAGYKFNSSLTSARVLSGPSSNLTGPTTDLDGNSRGTKPDIGCYEVSD